MVKLDEPFAGFENFAACVIAQKAKGKSDLSARKICGALKAEFENKKEAFLNESNVDELMHGKKVIGPDY